MLESAVIATCAAFGVEGFRTENPGVWVSDREKLCAVGVHLRRYVSSHGVGLNVGEDVREWMDRIVACGLEGMGPGTLEGWSSRKVEGGVGQVAGVLAREISGSLEGVEGIKNVSEEDVCGAAGGEAEKNDSL
jgi:lipoate-protein ligase B